MKAQNQKIFTYVDKLLMLLILFLLFKVHVQKKGSVNITEQM